MATDYVDINDTEEVSLMLEYARAQFVENGWTYDDGLTTPTIVRLRSTVNRLAGDLLLYEHRDPIRSQTGHKVSSGRFDVKREGDGLYVCFRDDEPYDFEDDQ